MKKILLVATVVVISGCAELKMAVGTYGAQASDEALSTAMWTMCAASPIGAIERRFNTPELKAARELICNAP